MAKTDYATPADWREVPAEMLSGDIKLAYDIYKESQRKAAADREAFEAAFATLVPLPPGKRLGFGYRFGKLSIAILDGEAKAKAPAAKPQPRSLADLLGIRSI